jgi:hypothetical protein
MNNQQNEMIDIGKFIAIYKKEKNNWRLQTDMFNTSMETRSPLEVPDYLTLPKNSSIREKRHTTLVLLQVGLFREQKALPVSYNL